jgi:AcrR family transcriptional regulator
MSELAQDAARRPRLNRTDRRKLILETTVTLLAKHGAEGTTLRSLCREMDVSPSLLTRFFDGWHEVLAATYDMITDRFLTHLDDLLKADFPDERTRMKHLIRHYLATDWAGESTIGAMIALWQLSRTVTFLRGSFTRFLADRHRVLHPAVHALAKEAESDIALDDVTVSFLLMMDGIWLHMSLNPGNISEDQGESLCWSWLVSRLEKKSWQSSESIPYSPRLAMH